MTDFAIYALDVGGGHLALSPNIDGAAALDIVAKWAPDLVICMLEPDEIKDSGHAKWIHFPVKDFDVPAPDTAQDWTYIEAQVHDVLVKGGRVLVHCKGGCGRSGMAVLRLMIATGEPANTALARLRKTRPCAVETQAQLDWAYSARA